MIIDTQFSDDLFATEREDFSILAETDHVFALLMQSRNKQTLHI